MSVLPPAWVWTDTASVAEVQGGIQKQPKRAPRSNRYPFLRVANVLRGQLDLQQIHEIELFDDELEKFRLCHGDLLVVEGNGSPNQIGRAALWLGEIENCVHQNHLIRVRPTTAIDSKYLAYYWNASRTTEYLRSIASSTSGLYVLTAGKVRGVRIPLPPLKEQGRIVASIEEQFSRVDAGVAALSRIRWNLKRLRAAVVQAAVTGLILGSDARSSPDWQQRPMGEVLQEIQAGKSFKCEERPARADEWGVIKVSAMTWGHFRENENKTVVPGRPIDERLEIRPGDLLVSRANTVDYVGAVVHVGECRPRLLLSDKSLRLVPRADVLPEWLVIALRSRGARRYIEAVATGTSDSMRNISQPKLRAMTIPIPSLPIQTALVREVSRLMSLIDQLDLTVLSGTRAAEALRSSILAAGFSGKLVPQNPDDESASVLLERIAGERATSNGHTPRTRAHRQPKAMA